MSKNIPKKFWEYINKFRKNGSSNILDKNMSNFVEHFKNISNSQQPYYFHENYAYTRSEPVWIGKLDSAFTVVEISKAIRSMS